MTGYNLPPGCNVSDIPGWNDITVSFDIEFNVYGDYEPDDDKPITRIAKELVGFDVSVLTYQTNSDNGTFVALVRYSDDIDIDESDIYDSNDVYDAIIKYMNSIMDEVSLDKNDQSIEIDYKVHG